MKRALSLAAAGCLKWELRAVWNSRGHSTRLLMQHRAIWQHLYLILPSVQGWPSKKPPRQRSRRTQRRRWPMPVPAARSQRSTSCPRHGAPSPSRRRPPRSSYPPVTSPPSTPPPALPWLGTERCWSLIPRAFVLSLLVKFLKNTCDSVYTCHKVCRAAAGSEGGSVPSSRNSAVMALPLAFRGMTCRPPIPGSARVYRWVVKVGRTLCQQPSDWDKPIPTGKSMHHHLHGQMCSPPNAHRTCAICSAFHCLTAKASSGLGKLSRSRSAA